jgi:dolichyl-phosphate-mannose--protein O-mannosyl transferase
MHMTRKETALLLLVFLIAFGLRCYDFSYPSFRWADENAHIPAATNYMDNGQFEPDFWEHPPLRHIILYGFLQIFGDNPAGWRMRNILFGAVTAVLVYLFAREVSGSRKAAVMAGLLIATDPLHIVLSRYTFEEIYGGALFLTAVVLFMKHAKRSWMIMLSAVFMGCSLAIKWYYVPCWLLLYVLLLREDNAYRNPKTALFLTSVYILIPVSVFILSYYQWFGRGYTFPEFVEFITNAYYSLQKYRPQNFQSGMMFLTHQSSLEWFTRPVIVGQGTYLGTDRGEFVLYMNSLPIWILTFPAMIALTVLAVREKSLNRALPVLLFCASYLLFIFVKRPVFIYSASTLLPFAFTAMAIIISRIDDRYGARIYPLLLALMLAWNAYLYPLATAKKIPIAPYRYLLDKADIKLL